MNAQVGKWVNSLPVRIPRTYARELGLAEGAELELTRVDGALLLRPRKREHQLEVPLASGLPVHGVVLADYVKGADWQERKSEHIATVPAEVLDEVRAKLKPLLGI